MNEQKKFEQFSQHERDKDRNGSFERPLIDCGLTRKEALNYPQCPPEILEAQELVGLKYVSVDQKFHEGQMVIHRELAKDIQDLFAFILTLPESEHFPVESVKPVILYNSDDEVSMAANNSSGFNYRKIEGKDELSNHAYGMAFDLNPRQNPVIIDGQVTQPASGEYDPSQPGTLYEGHPIVEFMKARGWEWGGDWTEKKDYQHFAKVIVHEKI
jgi:peptidoglycan LD-endopeptidase CwlK